MRAKEQTASLSQQSEKAASLMFSDSIRRLSSATIIRDESGTIRLLPEFVQLILSRPFQAYVNVGHCNR